MTYLAWKAQMALLLTNEVNILNAYADFLAILSKESIKILSEKASINNFSINVVDNKQQLQQLIYSLDLVEFKSLKIDIKTTIAKVFI